MNNFDMQQMEMLTEMGYDGDFIENIETGDEIAMLRWKTGEDGGINFLRADNVKKIGRDGYEPLVQFIGIHENGVREPMSYGSGWKIFRKAHPVRIYEVRP
jgi:hypothetical protein